MGQLWGSYGAGLTHTCAPQHDFVVGERPQGTMAALIRRALGADDDDDDDVGGAAPQVVSYGAALPHKWGVRGGSAPQVVSNGAAAPQVGSYEGSAPQVGTYGAALPHKW